MLECVLCECITDHIELEDGDLRRYRVIVISVMIMRVVLCECVMRIDSGCCVCVCVVTLASKRCVDIIIL